MFLDLFSNIMLMHVYPCSLSDSFPSAAFCPFLPSASILLPGSCPCFSVGHLEVENLPCFLSLGFIPLISKLAFKVLDDNRTDHHGEMGVPLTHYETENLRISGTSLQHHGLAHITD